VIAAPTAVAPRARSRLLRLAAADVVAVAGLAVLCAALLAVAWRTWGDLGSDTGYDLVAGARVAHGSLPYTGFVYYYGPLAPFVVGLATWLGGAGLAPAVGLGIVLALAIVAATYALARTQTTPVGAFAAAAIAAPLALGPGNLSFVLPHSESATVGILLLLCFLLAATRFAATDRPAWLVAAGACAGLISLTRPEDEAAVVAAACVFYVVRVRTRDRGFGGAARLFGPAALVPAAVYGAFAASVSLHRLVADNLYPVHELRAGGNRVLRLTAPLTAGSFASLAGKLVLYCAGVAALLLVACALERRGRLRSSAIAALAGAAVTLAAVAAMRPETVRYYLHYAYGWIPAGAVVAVVVLLRRYRRHGGGWTAADHVALATTVVLAVLAAKTYAGFLFFSRPPQFAVYAAPFAVVFLARLHLVELARSRSALALGAAWLLVLAVLGIGLATKDARAKSVLVQGPQGALAASPADAPAYQAALRWIDSRTRSGDAVLLGPQLTALYTLSGRTDPLPQISLLPGALHDARAERDAMQRLQRAHVRLAIIDRRRFPEYGNTTFGGSFDRVLAALIRQRFAHVATLRGGGPKPRVLDVWLRTSA